MRLKIWLSVLLLFLSVTLSRAEKRIALVVGNSAYQNAPPLSNPKNDATLIAATLRKAGFALIGDRAHLDLDKTALEKAIKSFGAALIGADVALFYYAGHGIQIRGSNYLVPVSANPAREADVGLEAVDVAMVLQQMEGSGTRLKLVILDACRNNPFSGRGLRSTQSGLAQLQAPEGTLLSYATQPGNVALDGAGDNSPYTAALVQTIQKPGIDVFQTFNQVGLLVKRATGGAQQPWVSSSPIDGDFHFTANATAVPAAPPPAPMPPSKPAQAIAAVTPPAARVQQRSLEQRALDFVVEDMKKSQEKTAAEYLQHARRNLDEQIDYYGKLTSRDEVLKDKERYVARWPLRSYQMQTETTRISCDDSKSTCQVSGVLNFSHSNPANGKKRSGTASYEFSIRFDANGGRIFYEQGKTLSARQ